MMRSTPGPWRLRGFQIRANGGVGTHVASYQLTEADGKLLAAAPTMLQFLLGACRSLDACESGSRSHCTADAIRRMLAERGLIVLGNDEHGRPSEREDPIETITGDEP